MHSKFIITDFVLFMNHPPVLDNPDDIVIDVADLHVLPHGRLDVLDSLDPGVGVQQACHSAILDTIH